MGGYFGRRAGGERGPRPSLAKERFWRGHVARQAAEGISVRAYCRKPSADRVSGRTRYGTVRVMGERSAPPPRARY